MSIDTDSMTRKTNYSVWDGSVARSFDGGKGTKENPYLISNGAQLAYMREVVDKLSIDSTNEGMNYENPSRYEYYKLTCDIHLGAKAWLPIGSYSLSAQGNIKSASFNFNGDNHVIYGLEISQKESLLSPGKYVGLFGILDYNSTISNLRVVDGNVNGEQFVGGIAGILKGKIENCTFSGTVNGKTEVGGIVGKIEGHMFNCSNKGTISGNEQIGGLAGKITEGYIHSGINYGIVKGRVNVGGIVGFSTIDGEMSSLILCINNGSVNGGYNVAGIAGSVISVSYCVNRAKIQGEVSVGGICGISVTADHCYNDATVEGLNLIGGIVGDSYKITESINNGSIKGNNQIGGIVGRSEGREVERCYNRGNVSGNGGIGGIIGNATRSDYIISDCYNGGFVIHAWAGGPILGSHEGTKQCEAQIVDSYYYKGCVSKSAINLSNFQYIHDLSAELTAQNKEIILTALQQNKNSIQDMSQYDTMAYRLYAEYADKIVGSVIEQIERAFSLEGIGPEGSGEKRVPYIVHFPTTIIDSEGVIKVDISAGSKVEVVDPMQTMNHSIFKYVKIIYGNSIMWIREHHIVHSEEGVGYAIWTTNKQTDYFALGFEYQGKYDVGQDVKVVLPIQYDHNLVNEKVIMILHNDIAHFIAVADVNEPKGSGKSDYDITYNLNEDEALFVAVVAAESIGEGQLAWQVVSNVIMNRVGQREWSKLTTPTEVMKQKYQFSCLNDGGSPQYLKAVNYLKNRVDDGNTYEQIISVIMPIYHKEVSDITGGAQLYYSPKSMVPPGSAPSWASVYKQITVPGIKSDDFMLYTGEKIQ